MGIELKSWYLLAKESEPSFRFTVTPRVCNIQDLLVVVPWVFSNVLSGNPIIFSPYIESARYVAEYKNYWWQHVRKANDSTEIRSPVNCGPYPDARDNISDSPSEDRGKNFGRSEYQDAGMTRRWADDSGGAVGPCNIYNSSPAK